MAKKPVRARTARRIEARANAAVVRDKERLARLERGGNPERPIAVTTASLVEPDARGRPCPLCGGPLRVLEHAAREGLRVVRAVCTQCGVSRDVYYRVDPPHPN